MAGDVDSITDMAVSERVSASTSTGPRLAAVLCLTGGIGLLTLAGLSIPKALGADDTADGGLGVAFVAVFAGFAGLLLYAGHVLWWRARRLPARLLAGFVLVVAGIGLVAELAESGGHEVTSFAGWIATIVWSIAILVTTGRRRR
jgi:hypothetical protein